ncbi:unnamed protein product [Danaus chrysippus]|uniref:(African queen) hypothetical protein n=1 Tax=Danaus chrysippus TaxID=151541 RepID=A0A8J2WAM3_9NEOP|nr:unnamed protein product [Danaus chrysippus]
METTTSYHRRRLSKTENGVSVDDSLATVVLALRRSSRRVSPPQGGDGCGWRGGGWRCGVSVSVWWRRATR